MDEATVEVATSVAGPRLAVLLHFDDAGDVYEVLGGVRVPTRAEVRWDLREGPFVYFRGQISELELS